ncbi:MAG: 6-phosphogluconolactonase [Calditrichaceae bacterium]|nr:6-phosphogluconolactonase [Calditrichaceae bacterium]MBN2709768.1 6-phosphogluconolactonase [Calditrichaceae bacterium]RQV94962.1 MAG: 6-phosphogluconolactonase [Calditrichota bacterium]
MSDSNIHVFENQQALVRAIGRQFLKYAAQASEQQKPVYTALSGGTTPKALFEHLAWRGQQVDWQNFHFYWVDERCVRPGHEESNFGMAEQLFFSKIKIPAVNLHRIRGESDPETEVERYTREIEQHVEKISGWPVFDWILLGLGEDGHTASLFPGDDKALDAQSICVTAKHPHSGQNRISLTLPVINRARHISFMVSGTEKAKIADRVIKYNHQNPDLPAARVKPMEGIIEWYLDARAASLL